MNRLNPQNAAGTQPSALVIPAALALLERQGSETHGFRASLMPAGAPAPAPVYRYAIASSYFAATYYDMAG
jgi:hypothetical protein